MGVMIQLEVTKFMGVEISKEVEAGELSYTAAVPGHSLRDGQDYSHRRWYKASIQRLIIEALKGVGNESTDLSD